MISYNLLEDVLNKKINNKPIIDFYCEKFISLINDNLIADDTFDSINEISEYESSNIGMDYYENVEMNYDYSYKEIIDKKNLIKDLVNKKKDELNKFIKELKRIPIPKQANDENQYRILSFPWCISGNILSTIKYINFDLNINLK